MRDDSSDCGPATFWLVPSSQFGARQRPVGFFCKCFPTVLGRRRRARIDECKARIVGARCGFMDDMTFDDRGLRRVIGPAISTDIRPFRELRSLPATRAHESHRTLVATDPSDMLVPVVSSVVRNTVQVGSIPHPKSAEN